MTQSSATPTEATRPNRPPRPTPRPTPGTHVRYEGLEEVGMVVESDDFMDTLQRRGTPISAQVLVEWPRNDNPVRTWELVSTLATV